MLTLMNDPMHAATYMYACIITYLVDRENFPLESLALYGT